MPKKLPAGELLRLACIYAERDQEEYARCTVMSDPNEAAKAREFVRQVREYRMRRWGATKLEQAMSNAVEVPVAELAARLFGESPPTPSE